MNDDLSPTDLKFQKILKKVVTGSFLNSSNKCSHHRVVASNLKYHFYLWRKQYGRSINILVRSNIRYQGCIPELICWQGGCA